LRKAPMFFHQQIQGAPIKHVNPHHAHYGGVEQLLDLLQHSNIGNMPLTFQCFHIPYQPF